MKCHGRKIKIVGVGGTIGSGKTTVARFFGQLGAYRVSADRIGKRIMPRIAPRLIKAFGPSIQKGSKIDVAQLRRIAFSSVKNTRKLNRISHPVLLKELMARIKRFRSGIMIIDAALLFDWPEVLEKTDYTVLVTAPDAAKERRSLAKGIDKKTFWCIINVQRKEKEMAKQADFIIPNNTTLTRLKKHCRTVFREIKNGC